MGGKAGLHQNLWETNTQVLWPGLKNETGVGWRRISSTVFHQRPVCHEHMFQKNINLSIYKDALQQN